MQYNHSEEEILNEMKMHNCTRQDAIDILDHYAKLINTSFLAAESNKRAFIEERQDDEYYDGSY